MTCAPDHTNTPPKPRLVLRVGVTGHRTQPLREMGVVISDLQELMKGLLKNIQKAVESTRKAHADLFAEPESELRLITALAAGSDSLAAEAATEAGLTCITAILPFPEKVYELDFTEKVTKRQKEVASLAPDAPDHAHKQAELSTAEEDVARFKKLCAQAGLVKVELDGDRTDDVSREAAYVAAAQILVNHADLLIAVWDNQTNPNRGGTWRVVSEALRLGIPVVHIRPVPAHPGARLEMKVLAGSDELHRRNIELAEYFEKEFARVLLPPDLWPAGNEDTKAGESQQVAAVEARVGDALRRDADAVDAIEAQAADDEKAREASLRIEYHHETYRKWIRGPFAPPRAHRSLLGLVGAWATAFAFGLFTLPIGGIARMLRAGLSGQLWDRLTKARDRAAGEALRVFPGDTLKLRMRRWWERLKAMAMDFGRWVVSCATVRDPWSEWTNEWDKVWAQAALGDPEMFRDVQTIADRELRSHRCWAEMLAQYYANLYRSAAVLIYILAALAVAAAIMPIFFYFVLGFGSGEPNPGGWVPHHTETFWLFTELVLIVYIGALLAGGRRWQWHDRYIDYRMIAENLRILRYLMPLGRTTQFARVPAHNWAGDPGRTWAFWHYRAVVRAAGLIPCRFDADYVTASARLWQAYVVGQQRYHRELVRWLKPLLVRLKWVEYSLLGGTVLACVFHLMIHHLFPENPCATAAGAAMTLFAALLPALGTSLFAWLRFLDAETVEKREDAMARRLAQLEEDLERFLLEVQQGKSKPTRAILNPLVDLAVQVMSDETLDWRVQFSGQVLAPPP